jgi:hypothetical protein
LHGRNPRGLDAWRRSQVEFLRVDTDVDRRTMLQYTLNQLTAHGKQPTQVRQDLEQAHHGQTFSMLPRLAARGDHARTGDTGKPRIGHARAKGFDELSAQIVARSFPCDQNE